MGAIALPPYGKMTASTERTRRRRHSLQSCRAHDGFIVTSKAWCAQRDDREYTVVYTVIQRTRSGLTMGQWRRQDFVTGGRSEVWVYMGSRVRSPTVPVVLSVYQRGSLLDGLAMYSSRDTKKFHDNERNTHILHNFWTSTNRGGSFPPSPWRRHCCTFLYT